MTIRKWLQRKWKRFKYRMGWRYCPLCRQFVRIRWVQVPVLFEDEPPMFFYYQCPSCKARTMTMPTGLTEDAVRSLGYSDFREYSKKVLEKKDERSQTAQ